MINFAFEDQELSISDSDSNTTDRENGTSRRANNVVLQQKLAQLIRFSRKLVEWVDHLDRRLEKDAHVLQRLSVSAENIFPAGLPA